MAADWIIPDWPTPPGVKAVSTTRAGGVSTGVYASFNLGEHVGDAPRAAAENRRRLRAGLSLGHEPHWLKQVHGTTVARLDVGPTHGSADAAVISKPGEACVIMTADCLPVLFCDQAGTQVAAAHAGWRGLAAGVLEATLRSMNAKPETILAWLGPAIGPQAYEVGEDVRRAFVGASAEAEQAFKPGKVPGKWWCDLYLLASQRLHRMGVRQIHGGGFCTYTERERFFSFRRDGETGRMATLIYRE